MTFSEPAVKRVYTGWSSSALTEFTCNSLLADLLLEFQWFCGSITTSKDPEITTTTTLATTAWVYILTYSER